MPTSITYQRQDQSKSEAKSNHDFKTALLMLLYMGLCMFFCTLILIVANNRLDERAKTEPLKDIAFDIVQLITNTKDTKTRFAWVFKIVEIWGLIVSGLFWFTMIIHKHRLIIIRRVGFIVGCLYLYRSFTMLATSLPVPGTHLKCDNSTTDVVLTMKKAVTFMAGAGLSITGAHNYCGDYLYSGHTVIIMIGCLFLQIYIPDNEKSQNSTTTDLKLPKNLLTFFKYTKLFIYYFSHIAILCILVSYDHYTIDIICAYYVTTRLVYSYHTGIFLTKLVRNRDQYRNEVLQSNEMRNSFRAVINNSHVDQNIPEIAVDNFNQNENNNNSRPESFEMSPSNFTDRNSSTEGNENAVPVPPRSDQISPNSNSLLLIRDQNAENQHLGINHEHSRDTSRNNSGDPKINKLNTNTFNHQNSNFYNNPHLPTHHFIFFNNYWWWGIINYLEKFEQDAYVEFDIDERLKKFIKFLKNRMCKSSTAR